jgi:hypothetical protein
MRLVATRIQFACDWRPRRYNLYVRLAVTGSQSHAKLYVLAASCMQSRQFLASTLRKQLFELKNEGAIKKSENLCGTMLAKAYPLTLCMARSNLVRQFL